ncbi:hypothetical protein HP567_012640 [Brevibacillus sp. M2.1A]|uniref:hypothetical protein n=1 Tax=Brevibacillus TaxID=55080 RepID=UPI00156B114A|nr:MULTISPECIES: hypothetical protein [Brevibacillus]MBY0088182.1 hypothetical protein [Brevibacillus brevis]MCC8435394.1 hypothetical protein [Brevibacillus sp. M2.1A]
MNDLKALLTQDQISEIELSKEMCNGMSVDGEPIICFEILSNILHNNLSIRELSKDEIHTVLVQLKGYKDFWKDAIWFQSSNINQIYVVFRELVKNTLREDNLT